ncbi:MAG TPA: hypothetical protein VNM22_15175 [Candidatus Limnocylindrales bacterium]|nr:hypothetical protein [Candidatus Limnocylindrales bacterium]
MKSFNLFSTLRPACPERSRRAQDAAWLSIALTLLISLFSLHPSSVYAEDLRKVTIKVGWMLCEK